MQDLAPAEALFGLSGKSALVTGASSGLGLHFARRLAASGAAVTLAARRRDALEAACAEINRAGGTARPVSLDVADMPAIAAFFEGNGAFDIVVNNAGVSRPRRAIEMEEADWDAVVDVNLKGAFFVARHAASAMKAAGRGGTIVNVASILGLRVSGGVAAYAASKAGLVQLTRSLALEWARHDIRVNALCPGYVETDINRGFFGSDAGQAMLKRIPQRRIGQADDLDGALLLLCSDAGRYMTGATLVVDGGHLVSTL